MSIQEIIEEYKNEIEKLEKQLKQITDSHPGRWKEQVFTRRTKISIYSELIENLKKI